MKVLIINGSPNRTLGNTGKTLGPLVDGLKQGGAEISTIMVADLRIEPCRACYACWKGKRGCVLDDDMASVLDKMREAEMLVLAAPLFVDHLPGPLKTLLDRTIPLALPQVELVDGHCRHPAVASDRGFRGAALLSVCGFWERDNFDSLCTWFDAFCRQKRCQAAGKLVRPHAYAYTAMPDIAPSKAAVTLALQQAGLELAQRGCITPELEDRVAAEVVSRSLYLRMANSSW